jgi:hypothetical protein
MSNNVNSSVRNAGKVFSDKALNFLLGSAGRLSAKSIAGQLGRTTKSIRRKAEKFGISLSL